ncbi:type II toxin-antitoxin system RelE/ParE family toxin [Bacteroides sp. OttesenSCG-928-E20]|nr:type II toxin-antitoxin system RelE/ParE family toxin [Bacteroides sp. OttesenSCG-928-E20]
MRKIIAYKGYYYDFISKLSETERKKIQRALLLFETEDKIPYHYIKFIRDEVYEFRVNYGNNEFRIFFVYDGDTIVVLFNCFKKKTQKTPKLEIDKAVKLKNEYYEQKGNL